MTTETAAEQKAAKRSKRAVRIAKTTNVAFSLEPKVRARFVELAKAEGMELGHYLQKVLETHLLDVAEDGDELADRLRSKRAVIDYVVALAQTLDSDGKFDAHFILTVMKAAGQDASFMAMYKTATGGGEQDAARAQKPLNQQLGRLIRKAASARGKRSEDGKVVRAQASGEIVSSYTLLER